MKMKAGTDLQERAHPAPDLGVAFRRLGDAGEDLQKGALAGAVAADDADDFALLYLACLLQAGRRRLLGPR